MAKESAYFTISNLKSKQDLKKIKKELDMLHGVTSVSVNMENNHIAIDFDNTGVTHQRIENNLNKMGYNIINSSGQEHIM